MGLRVGRLHGVDHLLPVEVGAGRGIAVLVGVLLLELTGLAGVAKLVSSVAILVLGTVLRECFFPLKLVGAGGRHGLAEAPGGPLVDGRLLVVDDGVVVAEVGVAAEGVGELGVGLFLAHFEL